MSKKKKRKDIDKIFDENINSKEIIDEERDSYKEDDIEKENNDKKKELTTDTTSISVIDAKDLNELIDEDLGVKKESKVKKNRHIFVDIFLIILLIISLVSFSINLLNNDTSVVNLINSLVITLFTIIFVVVSITYNRKSKSMILLSSLLLIGYFVSTIVFNTTSINYNSISNNNGSFPDFTDKSITKAIDWASKNSILINQEYEYSDMVKEYDVISQNIKSGSKINDTKEITLSISEGPNPYKEVIVPSMTGWDVDRVVNYVLDNHLSNVKVEFVESDKAKDTVIEQSVSGNLKRNEELKITFSYGEELENKEVKLIDFTNKTKFEVEVYMKQNQLRYEFDDSFDKKIKKGYAIKQSIKPSEVVHVDDEKIKVTFSKGPEIKIPDLKKYDMTKVTEWAIKNKVKVNFTDKYDDSIKENNVISFDHSVGDVIEQGSVLKVVLSRGTLKMPKFKSLNDFYEWANKYEIKYEEKHEFSDSVEAGNVISYSYKVGDSIKNNDTIIVKISDGKKKEVPNLKGLSKSEAISKLNKAGLKYTFIYKNSSSVSKDKVISQSISAGSEISTGTTITVTLSNGKSDDKEEKDNKTEKKTTEKNNTSSNKTDNNTSNSNNSNTNNTSSSNNKDNNKENNNTQSNTNNCRNVTVYIDGSHIDSNPTTTCSKIKGAYSSLKFTCSYSCGPTNGLLLNSGSIDEHTFSTCDTINLKIADSSKC